MARTKQLSQLRTDALRLADLENAANRFPSTEVNDYLNRGLAKVYAELLTVQDQPFYESYVTITVDGRNPPIYPLPLDFLSINSVEWNQGNGSRVRYLRPFTESERGQLMSTVPGWGGGALAYKITGQTGAQGSITQGTIPTVYGIEFLPAPAQSTNINIRYTPTCPLLVNDTDTFDGILGFEDAATTWAAILMRRKDDLPTEELFGDWTEHVRVIRTIGKRRDRSGPPRVQDHRTIWWRPSTSWRRGL